MPAISASAPGKIILFGEHAVVYGKPAVAIPVTEVKAKAIVMPAPGEPTGSIQIQAPEIEIDSPIKDLPLDHAIRKSVSLTLKELGIEHPPAFKLRVTSTIPLAAGLGSGAAVAVSIIQAVAGFMGRPLPDEKINQIAFEVEKIHHGTPSGIDNTVVTYAMPVYFVKGHPLERLQVHTPFTIVIGNTGVVTPTAVAVADVRSAWQKDPNRYYEIFDACGQIAAAGRTALENGDIASLGELMDQNQTWLERMGVSSPELEQLIHAAKHAGALGAKLSGGGRGGNMIALVEEGQAQAVADALATAGASSTIITRVGK